MIVEHEQKGKERAGYAEKTFVQLSADLIEDIQNNWGKKGIEPTV
jgi:hypothetical protein